MEPLPIASTHRCAGPDPASAGPRSQRCQVCIAEDLKARRLIPYVFVDGCFVGIDYQGLSTKRLRSEGPPRFENSSRTIAWRSAISERRAFGAAAYASSVGLDWLYLRTEKQIFLTDRHLDADRLRTEVPISRCADVIDASNLADLPALLTARLDHDEHHLARVAMRHHYFDDLHVGDSTARFLDAVSELVALRDQLLGSAPCPDDQGAAITA